MTNIEAYEEYNKARKAAMKQYRSSVLTGSSPYPPVLDEILSNTSTVGEQDLGVVEVPLELMVGTKTSSRKTAFTKDFLPLLPEKSEFSAKWSQLYVAHMEEGIREPVKAYEFMNRFYVQEGNKRVSVLKYVKAAGISAHVTRIIPAKTEEKENKIYYEFMAFYELTQMNSIWFSEPGGYLKLLTALDKKPKEPWSSKEKKDFSSFFYHFSTIYSTMGGNKLPLTSGDAFLIYLTIFDYKEARDKSANEIKKDLQKIWKEFLPSTQSIEHVMDPEQSQSPFWNKIIPTAPSRLKIAFLYDKPVQDSSWLYSHELGRLHLMDTYKDQVTTTTYENVKPGKMAEETIARAIEDGCQVIFTTTPTLMQASLKAAVEHPDVKILNCSLNFSYQSIRTYYARVYEAKFLLGLIAATISKDDTIAYEADYPIYGAIANINAFALGAQMVNPDIKIKLSWTSLKDTAIQEETSGRISILSARNMITPNGSDRRFGLSLQKDGQFENLATTILDWGKFYDKIIKNIFDGTWKNESSKEKKSLNYWWGLSSDVLDVVCSSKLPESTKKLVYTFKKFICSGTFHPFDGILFDQDGKQHGTEDSVMSHEDIITMDWLYENVIGSIPEIDELKEEAKSVVLLQGIQEELL